MKTLEEAATVSFLGAFPTPTDRAGRNVTEEGRPKVASEPAVLSCLACAATGDAITFDGTAYTVRVIQPEGSQVRLEDGSPASPVGELIDVIVKEVETAK